MARKYVRVNTSFWSRTPDEQDLVKLDARLSELAADLDRTRAALRILGKAIRGRRRKSDKK